ncbi:MAG: efflux RND transporter permease subunit, partial [Rhizobiales bacterium]|nr:efflux RND transporter permease subunit [Hyphomicrobiales bacterium]
TTLMAIGLFLVGMVAYMFLPVASLPSVDFPTIRVFASRPGADPATFSLIAATAAIACPGTQTGPEGPISVLGRKFRPLRSPANSRHRAPCG